MIGQGLQPFVDADYTYRYVDALPDEYRACSREEMEGHHRSAFDGSGLGLAIRKRIVQIHGGETSAASIEGQGSVFSVRIPE